MKRVIIACIFLFIFSARMQAQESLKILILPFNDASGTKDYNSYQTLISDTINTYINQIPKKIDSQIFKIKILNKIRSEEEKKIVLDCYTADILDRFYELRPGLEVDKLKKVEEIFKKISYKREYIIVKLNEITKEANVSDYEQVYTQAVLKNIEVIIYGYYFVVYNKIRIIFKALDVKTERLRAVYAADGDAGYNVFDLVIEASRELSENISSDTVPYPDNMNLYLKDKQSKIIAGYEKERFVFLNIGAVYGGLGFINKKLNVTNNIDISSMKNIYMNSINPSFNMEIYGSHKNNYYGFGLKFLIPYYYEIPNMQMSSGAGVGFLFGYIKEYFFSWSIDLHYQSFQKYGSDTEDKNEKRSMNVFYMGLGLSFIFRYMPKEYPFFFEFGSFITMPRLGSVSRITSGGPDLWNVSVDGRSSINWISPCFFLAGVGYFIKPDFGIYVKMKFFSMFILYDDDKNFYGADLGLSYIIDLGMVIRGAFK